MQRIISYLLIAGSISFFACTEQAKPVTDKPAAVTTNIVRVKPGSSFSDTLWIDKVSAVFYYPDSLQDLKIKSVTDSAIYNSSVHEMFYQMRYSKKVLKQLYPNIKIIEAKNVRYIMFQKKEKLAECIDLNTKNDARGLLIFNTQKSPQLVDMTNIETELDYYFKR